MMTNSGHSDGRLRGEDTAGFNSREAFFQRQELCDIPPPACVAEIRKVKAPIPRVLKSGGALSKDRVERAKIRSGLFGHEGTA
jgi:hypothetical protein